MILLMQYIFFIKHKGWKDSAKKNKKKIDKNEFKLSLNEIKKENISQMAKEALYNIEMLYNARDGITNFF